MEGLCEWWKEQTKELKWGSKLLLSGTGGAAERLRRHLEGIKEGMKGQGGLVGLDERAKVLESGGEGSKPGMFPRCWLPWPQSPKKAVQMVVSSDWDLAIRGLIRILLPAVGCTKVSKGLPRGSPPTREMDAIERGPTQGT